MGLLVTSLPFALVSGCGGDDGTGGAGGSAGTGTGGQAGSTAGTAGTGTGGMAGTTSEGGMAGTTGQGGMAGTTGQGGAAGATGEGGAAGMAGETGMAGAGGAGGAGAALCEEYCTILTDTCTGEKQQYPSMEQCLASCPAFPSTGETSGNSIECRVQHANLAMTAGVDPHCQHAGPAAVGPGEPCGGACPGYCSLMMTFCPDVFDTEQDCLDECETVPGAVPGEEITDYTAPAAAGNTIECRIYHATNAAVNTGDARALHCSHAAGEVLCVD